MRGLQYQVPAHLLLTPSSRAGRALHLGGGGETARIMGLRGHASMFKHALSKGYNPMTATLDDAKRKEEQKALAKKKKKKQAPSSKITRRVPINFVSTKQWGAFGQVGTEHERESKRSLPLPVSPTHKQPKPHNSTSGGHRATRGGRGKVKVKGEGTPERSRGKYSEKKERTYGSLTGALLKTPADYRWSAEYVDIKW
jgi:hypothetical protein